jgi:hypothetical protein
MLQLIGWMTTCMVISLCILFTSLAIWGTVYIWKDITSIVKKQLKKGQ